MGLLQSPDPAQKLARQYGIRGIFTPEIVPSLQPVVIIDDLSKGISNVPQRIALARINQTFVANEFTIFRFETKPNVMAQIQRIGFVPSADTQLKVFFGSSKVAPASVVVGAYTDGRLRLKEQTPACILGADTYATALGAFHMELAGENTAQNIKWQEVNWIVGANDVFDFVEMQISTVATAGSLFMQWEEFDSTTVR